MGGTSSKSRKNKANEPLSYEPDVKNENPFARYYLPLKTGDIDIMHLVHFYYRYIWEGCFSVPLEAKLMEGGVKVLDVGCGAGTWLLDLSTQYNYSKFVGIDIMPVFPVEIKPENLEFVEGDVLKGLPFDDNTFDFVHQETMGLSWTLDNWPFVISEIIRVTKPGGYMQFSDPDVVSYGPILGRFFESMRDVCELRNVDGYYINTLDKVLENYGEVTNICKDSRDAIMYEIAEGLSAFMNITKEEYFKLWNKVEQEAKEYKSVTLLHRIWCQKK
ncbi:17044_t:CDS:2 [Funneliformis geosporum]|uniref:1167_t:CDS:1 n=1 Tax=Funneliformis geosporum TaxID=1117311 RepID=A0A9W4WLP5_9GLOM|nr:17044_t:CDS:2 [Funneliformis geosporum]CAI2171334.1 1167_t:CDS:2 [Funneliformis geosporum]